MRKKLSLFLSLCTDTIHKMINPNARNTSANNTIIIDLSIPVIPLPP